jgi:hypothetical protein
MEYTLTYSESVKGWVSFYSFNPDWIIGMNNYLYTFKGGDLYKHNVNESRNTFYLPWWEKLGQPEGAFTASKIISVFNDAPLENKLFKTLVLEGDSVWSATLQSDIQNSGFVESAWFEKKEATFFAFIRNDQRPELQLRSVNGIGKSILVNGGNEINFSISPLIDVGSIISVGDYLYFLETPTSDLFLAGEVTNIIRNYPAGINRILINTLIPDTEPIPTNDCYFLYMKNPIAESHGVLGHYCVFEVTNGSTAKVELFTVGSDVMKSFP